MGISVLMSIYKKENPDYLNTALQSIWDDQLSKPDEIIIVKDGKLTAKLDSVLINWRKKLKETLKTVELPNNVGLGHALNKGLKKCSNEFIARMDADDIAMPARFQQQVKFMKQNPGIDILSSWAIEIDQNGNELRMRQVPQTHEEIMELLWAIPMIHPAVMYKKSKILNVGSYSKSLKRRQDYELWFRCAKKGLKFANIQSPLIYYRFSDNYFAKNDVEVALQQVKIGYRGCRMISAPLRAYIGITIPLLRAILPNKFNKYFQRIINRFDPRKQTK